MTNQVGDQSSRAGPPEGPLRGDRPAEGELADLLDGGHILTEGKLLVGVRRKAVEKVEDLLSEGLARKGGNRELLVHDGTELVPDQLLQLIQGLLTADEGVRHQRDRTTPVDDEGHEVGGVVGGVEGEEAVPDVGLGLEGLKVARPKLMHRVGGGHGAPKQLHHPPHVVLNILWRR